MNPKLSDICGIVGVPTGTVGAWIHRRHVPFSMPDVVAGGTRRFSRDQAVTFGVFVAVARSVGPDRALAAMAEWDGGSLVVYNEGPVTVTVNVGPVLAKLSTTFALAA